MEVRVSEPQAVHVRTAKGSMWFAAMEVLRCARCWAAGCRPSRRKCAQIAMFSRVGECQRFHVKRLAISVLCCVSASSADDSMADALIYRCHCCCLRRLRGEQCSAVTLDTGGDMVIVQENRGVSSVHVKHDRLWVRTTLRQAQRPTGSSLWMLAQWRCGARRSHPGVSAEMSIDGARDFPSVGLGMDRWTVISSALRQAQRPTWLDCAYGRSVPSSPLRCARRVWRYGVIG
ncbi:hypothetical protein RS83_01122 [Microbacterium oxydans]|uniref:Uncharacterized protein n=1 Tax=Microbacterium oxydans TaxID=82380 RepID=A0A0F0L9V7_9MICO|nr:hypothetical protein RS83_01122 [Microbacterium oxydans]